MMLQSQAHLPPPPARRPEPWQAYLSTRGVWHTLKIRKHNDSFVHRLPDTAWQAYLSKIFDNSPLLDAVSRSSAHAPRQGQMRRQGQLTQADSRLGCWVTGLPNPDTCRELVETCRKLACTGCLLKHLHALSVACVEPCLTPRLQACLPWAHAPIPLTHSILPLIRANPANPSRTFHLALIERCMRRRILG